MNIQTNFTPNIVGLARRLHYIGAVKIDTQTGFKLKLHEANPSAPLSPYYFNLRIAENKGGPLTYGEVSTIAHCFCEYLKEHTIPYDGIAPVPRAGDPFAKAMQDFLYHSLGHLSIPLIPLEKEEGAGVRKIGKVLHRREIGPGNRVLLVDDLITKADSKKEAIESLRDAGYLVSDIIVFLDREQGAKDELAKMKVRLHSIVTTTQLMEIYENEGLISNADMSKIRSYMANN